MARAYTLSLVAARSAQREAHTVTGDPALKERRMTSDLYNSSRTRRTPTPNGKNGENTTKFFSIRGVRGGKITKQAMLTTTYRRLLRKTRKFGSVSQLSPNFLEKKFGGRPKNPHGHWTFTTFTEKKLQKITKVKWHPTPLTRSCWPTYPRFFLEKNLAKIREAVRQFRPFSPSRERPKGTKNASI